MKANWMRLLTALLLLGLVGSCQPVPTVTPTPVPASSTPPPTQPTSGLPAFPGAEGFGSMTSGGRGGAVLEVTNLDDSGAGSLRAAVEAEGPRVVIFRVAGTIELQSDLKVTHPFLTIAGQTAPGGGITLRGMSPDIEAILMIETHDVVVRYLTIRAGPPSVSDGIAVLATKSHDTYNIVLDHNSVSWAVNRDLMTWYDVHDLSIQWNIFSEGLNCSIHPKGCHSKGALLGGYASDENKDQPGARNLSFHHNLMAHNGERNPLVSTSGVVDVVNNVAYNPLGSFSHVDMQGQLTVIPVNFVANYFKAGADTDPNKYSIDVASQKIFGAQIFVQGNIGPHRADDSQPEIDAMDPDARPYAVTVRNPATPITTTSATEAYRQVLEQAGANLGLACDGTFFQRRDSIDARIVADVQNGTGRIIDDPAQVGGWLTIPAAAPCDDSDHDGMPDLWESQHGFDPHDPSDSVLDADADGYTNLEEFLNGTNPNQKKAPNATN